MSKTRLRRQIAWEAARLMYSREESEYYRAKIRAARQLGKGRFQPADLPSNAEIRDQVQSLARTHEGPERTARLLEMRLEALRVMRLLARFQPHLIGSVLTGHIRQGSDIDLHVFSNHVELVSDTLSEAGIVHEVERKPVVKDGQRKVYTHVRLRDSYDFELTVYPAGEVHLPRSCSITGKKMARADIAELESLLEREYPELRLDDAVAELETHVDRFQVYESLLLPLEQVRENPRYHPEGDVLYHSLQVFTLAREELPYDEDFLLAALLHDVGKGIDRGRHVEAALEALEGTISERTAWLIEHHMAAHGVIDGSIGVRARRRLSQSESFEELVLLAECDRRGRQRGVPTPDVTEALEYIRDLDRFYGA